MVKAESEVVLLPSFVFASILCILMTHAAVQLCGGYCCQIGCFFHCILRPVYSMFRPVFTWKALWKSATRLNEVKV